VVSGGGTFASAHIPETKLFGPLGWAARRIRSSSPSKMCGFDVRLLT
jgi:hypothetical protein